MTRHLEDLNKQRDILFDFKSSGNLIPEKKVALKPILESSNGIHLTAYLVNRGDLGDLKSQLRETISEAYDFLYSVQTIDERKKFFEPIDLLLNDERIFKSMKGNIGLFRTKDSFRIINVPVEVERQCHVATSFHVKPLLRWMQFDRDFLLLGLNQESLHLYFGNQTLLQRIDSVSLPEELPKKVNFLQNNAPVWLNEWIDEFSQKFSPRLFLTGQKKLIDSLDRKLKFKNVAVMPSDFAFDERNLSEICSRIRQLLKAEARNILEQAFFEFNLAVEENRGKKNIFQIAKAAVSGKVKKLIVADGINVFGKIDKKTGDLAIHPFDLDHEDDDILDDLAQAVLASGGEVIVAPREEIPKGRPILAILDGGSKELETTISEDSGLTRRNSHEKSYFL